MGRAGEDHDCFFFLFGCGSHFTAWANFARFILFRHRLHCFSLIERYQQPRHSLYVIAPSLDLDPISNTFPATFFRLSLVLIPHVEALDLTDYPVSIS